MSLLKYIKTLDEIDIAAKKYPRRAGVLAVKFFKERFRAKNWIDTNTESWKERQLNTKAGSTLVGKGTAALKKSIRITSSSSSQVIIGTDKAYAQAHNEGMRIKITDKMRGFFWARHYDAADKGKEEEAKYYRNLALTKKKHINIPKRQFMGESQALARIIDRNLLADFNRALKK